MSKTVADTPALESMAEIDARIRKTFGALTKVTQGVIAGHLRSVIVSGAPGCGKTHTLEKELGAGQVANRIKYESIKGTMSPIGLYQKLFDCQSKGSVLLIDDCDEIFGDLESLNILKASLDTGDTRMVHWGKESNILDAAGIKSPFEFEGSVMFVTNIDFVAEIAKDSKMSPHYSALVDRAIYVDLGIHSKREVLVRISQVVFTPEFLQDNNLTPADAKAMMAWLNTNQKRLRTISIRTIIQLASLVKTDGHWQELAEVVMLKR